MRTIEGLLSDLAMFIFELYSLVVKFSYLFYTFTNGKKRTKRWITHILDYSKSYFFNILIPIGDICDIYQRKIL